MSPWWRCLSKADGTTEIFWYAFSRGARRVCSPKSTNWKGARPFRVTVSSPAFHGRGRRCRAWPKRSEWRSSLQAQKYWPTQSTRIAGNSRAICQGTATSPSRCPVNLTETPDSAGKAPKQRTSKRIHWVFQSTHPGLVPLMGCSRARSCRDTEHISRSRDVCRVHILSGCHLDGLQARGSRTHFVLQLKRLAKKKEKKKKETNWGDFYGNVICFMSAT